MIFHYEKVKKKLETGKEERGQHEHSIREDPHEIKIVYVYQEEKGIEKEKKLIP